MNEMWTALIFLVGLGVTTGLGFLGNYLLHVHHEGLLRDRRLLADVTAERDGLVDALDRVEDVLVSYRDGLDAIGRALSDQVHDVIRAERRGELSRHTRDKQD